MFNFFKKRKENKKLKEDEQFHIKKFCVENDIASVDMEVSSMLTKGLVSAFMPLLQKAENYIELQVHSEGNTFTVTIQKCSGKTPHQLRKEAEEEVAKLDHELACKELELDRLKEIASCQEEELEQYRFEIKDLKAELKHATDIVPWLKSELERLEAMLKEKK